MATVAPLDYVFCSVLSGVPWSTYLELRALPENYHVRMTYDDGELEIMSPSRQHEKFAYFIGQLIDVYALVKRLKKDASRTMTFKRDDLEKGLEPDNCYYFANAPAVRGKEELDFTVDPPPDLVVEVALDRRPEKKLRLYAAFGVPEVWLYDGETLGVLLLNPQGRYEPAMASRSLPALSPSIIEQYIERLWRESEDDLVQEFFEWAAAHG